MIVMGSAAVNHSLPLTVPSTQNTAPVLDFRCLYTHDLRRKAKRWQDGILRFHTFNKRIMVFDLSKNFIGDTHWREKDPLQDGDELELEKGVLIQVGESTGTTVQDLSGLFERRKKAQLASPGEVPSAQPDPVSTARPLPAQASQLRPKSLNAVLGMPKGPLGRATVPSKSPCQLRWGNENRHTCEPRSVKRQRVESPSDKAALPVTLPSVRSAAPISPSSEGPVFSGNSRRVTEKTTTKFSGTALPRKPTTASKTTEVKSIPNSAFNQMRNSHSGNGTLASNSSIKTSKSSKSRTTEPATSRIIGANPVEREELRKVNFEQINQLQVVSRKSRKKLIYKDLLPEMAFSTKPSSGNHGARSSLIKATEPGATKTDPRVKHHQAEHNRLKARLKRIDEKQENQLHAIKGCESLYLTGSEDDNVVFVPSSPDAIRKQPPDIPQWRSRPSTEHGARRKNKPWMPSSRPDPPVQEEESQTHPTLPDPTAGPQMRIPPTQTFFEPLFGSSPHPPNTTDFIISIPATPPRNSAPQARSPVHSFSFSAENPRKRSSFRQTASESAVLPAPELDQKPDPWSREAWDLFGYGRPEREKKGDRGG